MIEGDRGLALRQIGTLFRAGTFAGMSDGQLLEHFLARHGEAGELAFAVLIERHGPMVLRVCRGALRSRVDAEDAFQATFLALVRGAGSIRNRDSLAPWLHGAALRVSACARSAQERRKIHEGRYASRRAESIRDGDRDDLGAVLHEEVGRLPARYRAAVVLCDLQGLPLVEAAVQLGCPVGTVKSRVARGRERLRARLVHRGVVPAAGLGLGVIREASAAVCPALVDATARAAIQLAAGRGMAGMLAASVEYLVRSNSRSILMRRVWTLTASLATAGVLAAGVAGLAQQGGGGGGAAASRQDPQNLPEGFREKIYNVGDLVGLVPQNADGTRRMVDMSPLIELISASVAPGTWEIYLYDDEGRWVGSDGQTWSNSVPPSPKEGHGRIIPYHGSSGVRVLHTGAVHAQLDARLHQLRRFVAARQKNEAIETPRGGGTLGMGAASAPGGMGMMGRGMGMMVGGGGSGGPPPAVPGGAGAPGGSATGTGMAGMMGGGMSGSAPAGEQRGKMGPGGPGGNAASGSGYGGVGMMGGGKLGSAPTGGMASGMMGGASSSGGSGSMSGNKPGTSGSGNAATNPGSQPTPGQSLGGASGMHPGMGGPYSGMKMPGGPGMSRPGGIDPARAGGAATMEREGETERRLRALEEKLDRVLKALDVPKAKEGGLGP